VPAAETRLLITAPEAEAPLTPLPDAISVPGLGTVAVRVAVALFLLSLALSRLKVFGARRRAPHRKAVLGMFPALPGTKTGSTEIG